MRRLVYWILCATALVSLLVPGVAAAQKLAGKEVVLGWIDPFSGWAAEWGQTNEVTVNIAVQEINGGGGVGGVPLRFIKYDSASKPDDAIKAARRLIEQDQVLAIMGPFLSTSAKMAFPVANRAGVVMISGTAAAKGIAAENRPWTFRNVVTSERMVGSTLDVFLKRNPNVKKVVLVYDNKDVVSKTQATQDFPPLLKERKIEIDTTLTFVTGDVDFSAQVTKVKFANPDAIVLSAVQYEGANFVKEVRRQGLKQPVVMGIGSSAWGFIRQGGEAVEGVVMPAYFWLGNPDPRAQAFIKNFRERKQHDPPHYTASVYDTVYILKKVIEESGVTNRPEQKQEDRKKIRDHLAKLKNFPGITGKTSIRPDGDADKEIYVVQVTKGEFLRIE